MLDQPTKPRCKLVGTDGNIFALLGTAGRALSKAGLSDKKAEMSSRVMAAGSYDGALSIICEYVEAE